MRIAEDLVIRYIKHKIVRVTRGVFLECYPKSRKYPCEEQSNSAFARPVWFWFQIIKQYWLLSWPSISADRYARSGAKNFHLISIFVALTASRVHIFLPIQHRGGAMAHPSQIGFFSPLLSSL